MKIVFLSNYFTHHQEPLSDALAKLSSYHFIATAPMTQERRNLGWGYDREPEYVCHYATEREQSEEIIARADVIISGFAPEKGSICCAPVDLRQGTMPVLACSGAGPTAGAISQS